MKLSKSETDFVKAQGVARLSTVNAQGMPHNVPVCPVWDGGNVYVATEKGAVKMKNLEANSKATIVFDVYRDSWRDLRGVMLQCVTHVVGEAEFKRIRRKLYTKYPHYKTDAPLQPEDSAIIELRPDKK